MTALDTFRNCSNFIVEQSRVIAHVRGVSAPVCCAILSTVVVVLVKRVILPKTRNRVCGTVVKCLSFGLIAISVLYLLDLSLQLVHHYYYDEKFCEFSGFLNQYFGAVQLLFAVGISLALFFKIGQEIFPSWKSFFKEVEEKKASQFQLNSKRSSSSCLAVERQAKVSEKEVPSATGKSSATTSKESPRLQFVAWLVVVV